MSKSKIVAPGGRSLDDIDETGVSWATEAEFGWLCDEVRRLGAVNKRLLEAHQIVSNLAVADPGARLEMIMHRDAARLYHVQGSAVVEKVGEQMNELRAELGSLISMAVNLDDHDDGCPEDDTCECKHVLDFERRCRDFDAALRSQELELGLLRERLAHNNPLANAGAGREACGCNHDELIASAVEEMKAECDALKEQLKRAGALFNGYCIKCNSPRCSGEDKVCSLCQRDEYKAERDRLCEAIAAHKKAIRENLKHHGMGEADAELWAALEVRP